MKTKHFKNLCPHTNSEMEISVLYQEVPMTGTLSLILFVLNFLPVHMGRKNVLFFYQLQHLYRFMWHRFIRCS